MKPPTKPSGPTKQLTNIAALHRLALGFGQRQLRRRHLGAVADEQLLQNHASKSESWLDIHPHVLRIPPAPHRGTRHNFCGLL